MKLLCVIPSYWPAFKFGGPIFGVHSLNRVLVKKGINVTVYTTNVGLDYKSVIKDAEYKIKDVVWETELDGVKVIYFSYTHFFEFLGETGWQFSLPMAKALNKNIKNFDLVYIVSTWNFPVALASYYCRKFKKPYIISPRGHLYNYVLQKKSWKKLPYYYLILKRDLQNSSAIHYTTEDEAEQCHKILELKNKYFVIPNGINLSEYINFNEKRKLIERFPHLNGKKIILFLGRINWKKGLNILISAFSMLVRERDDVHLLIVGDDDGDGYKEKVENWIKDYGIRDRVTFTGMLVGRDKLDAFACAEIFVLPSYSENFGMAAVEAMACGIPVVISNKVGIYREVEKNKAGIVVDTTAEDVYRGIKLLLDNAHIRNETAKNGRRLVEEYYDINKVADKMIEVYEEILNNFKI